MRKLVFVFICLASISSPLFAFNFVADLLTGAVLMGKTPASKDAKKNPKDVEWEEWFKVANEIRKKDSDTPASRLMRFRRLVEKEDADVQLNLLWACNEKGKEKICHDEAYEFLVDKKYLRCMDPSFFSPNLDTKEKIIEKAANCIPKAIEYADDEIKDYDKLIESRSKEQK